MDGSCYCVSVPLECAGPLISEKRGTLVNHHQSEDAADRRGNGRGRDDGPRRNQRGSYSHGNDSRRGQRNEGSQHRGYGRTDEGHRSGSGDRERRDNYSDTRNYRDRDNRDRNYGNGRPSDRDRRARSNDDRDYRDRRSDNRDYRDGRSDNGDYRDRRQSDRPYRDGGDRNRGQGSRGGDNRSGNRGGYSGGRDGDRNYQRRSDRPGGHYVRTDRHDTDDSQRSHRPGQNDPRRNRNEPLIPEGIEASDLPKEVRRDLLGLSKDNADLVAKHLVAAYDVVEEDPQLALKHARAARNHAGRVGVVRESAGVISYLAGDWAEALSELRTARRIMGGPGLLAIMADSERGLGRPEKAIELARSDEASQLDPESAEELRIVVAGAREDMGQLDAAIVTLEEGDLNPSRRGTPAARYFYAYAEALLKAERKADAIKWFQHAVTADEEQETDAEERVIALTSTN